MGLSMTSFAASKKFTLVIDAGHGGGDTGAVGAISKEKNLTLKFALAFGQMVERNCPDVKVVYTRKTDVFVELYRRAEIANKAKADLFISVHINALPRGRVARGFQTYTLGTSKRTGKKTGVLENLEVAKRENSVIFLEKDYKQTYQGYDPNSPESDIIFDIVQDKNIDYSIELAKYMQKYVCQATGRQDMGAQQDNLAVLRLSSMPGCLLELGFISTRDEENFMNSKNAESLYAKGMFNAFLAYYKHHYGSANIPFQPVMSEPAQEAAPQGRPFVTMQPVAPTPKEGLPSAVPDERKTIESTPAPVASQPVAPQPVAPQPVAPQPVAQPEVKAEPKADVVQPSDAPVFKVQVLTSKNKLKANDKQLEGLSDVSFYEDGGLYKYTVGSSEDYNVIYRLRKEIVAKYPNSFIIAFKNGVRTDVQEAIKEFKRNKRK
jgi:N-acetylmuramoyl-L-alanine amidase